MNEDNKDKLIAMLLTHLTKQQFVEIVAKDDTEIKNLVLAWVSTNLYRFDLE
jgi:hypothetical protein